MSVYLATGVVAAIIVLTPFAIFDKWRSSLYDPILIGGAMLVGLILNLISLGLGKRPMVVGFFASIVFFVGFGFLLAAMSSPNDLTDAIYMLAIICAFPILNAYLFRAAEVRFLAPT